MKIRPIHLAGPVCLLLLLLVGGSVHSARRPPRSKGQPARESTKKLSVKWRVGTVEVDTRSVVFRDKEGRRGVIDFGMQFPSLRFPLRIVPGERSTTILTRTHLVVTNGSNFAFKRKLPTKKTPVVQGYSLKAFSLAPGFDPRKVQAICGDVDSGQGALVVPGKKNKPHMYVIGGKSGDTTYSYLLDGVKTCAKCRWGSVRMTMLGNTVYLISVGQRFLFGISDANTTRRRVFRIGELSRPLSHPLEIEQHSDHHVVKAGSGKNKITVRLSASGEYEVSD